jgi:hypothetical protein
LTTSFIRTYPYQFTVSGRITKEFFFRSLNREEPVMTSKKKSKLVPIVAGVLGGFTGLVILGFIIYKTARNWNAINGDRQSSRFKLEPFIFQSRPTPNTLTADVNDTGTTATTTNRDVKDPPIHNRMASIATSLVSAIELGSGSSSNSGAPTIQAISPSSPSQPNYSKLSGQAHGPEIQIQSPQQMSLSSPENVGPNAEVDTTITAQIDALKREVQGLREAHQEMLGIVAPPEYDAEPPGVVRVAL